MFSSTTLAVLNPLLGGVLIGLASWLLLASLGRVAGVSGIAAAVVSPTKADASNTGWRVVFMIGLILGGWAAHQWLAVPTQASRPYSLLVLAGLLVGFGTVLGSGCTSGHGVCGLGRRSLRSLAATLTFMGTGFMTVFAIHAITGKAML